MVAFSWKPGRRKSNAFAFAIGFGSTWMPGPSHVGTVQPVILSDMALLAEKGATISLSGSTGAQFHPPLVAWSTLPLLRAQPVTV